MDVVSRLFIELTLHSFYIYMYLQKDIVWKHRDVCQHLWSNFRWNGPYSHAEFCATYLTICHHPNILSPWSSSILVVNYFCIFFDLWGGLCDNLLLTQCSRNRRNSTAWFPTESHFSFFIASVPHYHFSTTPQIPSIRRQRQKMLWLFPSSFVPCKCTFWLLLATACNTWVLPACSLVQNWFGPFFYPVFTKHWGICFFVKVGWNWPADTGVSARKAGNNQLVTSITNYLQYLLS